ncbi:MAG TPA: CopG family transcriptional regulator [Nitriliruptorales bacterium]
MRTTVRLPDDLHERAKKRAAEAGVTFTQLLEDALRLVLRDDLASEAAGRYEVDPLPRGCGLQAGVDLTDTSALIELMEGR